MTTERIKLCLVTNLFYPIPAGGAERFRRYAPGLRERGIDLEVITSLPSGYADLKEHEIVDGIPIIRLPLADPLKDFPQLMKFALKQFQKAQRKPDIVQIFAASPKTTNTMIRICSKRIGIIFVSTMVGEKSRSEGRDKIKEWLYDQISFWGVKHIVASTNVMKESIVSRGIRSKCISVIPNGVDVGRFHPASSLDEKRSLRQKLGILDDDQVIMFAGYIIPRKGVDLLIDAWPEIISKKPKARLILAGSYGETVQSLFPSQKLMKADYFNNITRIIETFPSKDRIVFTGDIANVEEYMRVADLFVLPSRQEGMGNVVLEAMATGLPCLLTPYIGLPSHEFGKPGREFILLNSYEPKELACRITQLLQDENVATTVGKSAHKWVQENMVIEKILDQYAAVYRNVSARKTVYA